MMQSCKFSPPNGSGNSGRCINNHHKVVAVTMTTTTTADADADANAPRQQLQQQQLPQQQRPNVKRWGVSTSKDVCGTKVGWVGGKQRPGNGSNNDRSGILTAAGKCGGDPGGAALPPLIPPFPLPPCAIDSSGGAVRRGVLLPGAARG
jgi:hypothetical protein